MGYRITSLVNSILGRYLGLTYSANCVPPGPRSAGAALLGADYGQVRFPHLVAGVGNRAVAGNKKPFRSSVLKGEVSGWRGLSREGVSQLSLQCLRLELHTLSHRA